MIIIRCDRCGAEDDLHSRILEVTFVNPVRTMYETDEIKHLCGYCWSRIQIFIQNSATEVVLEENRG